MCVLGSRITGRREDKTSEAKIRRVRSGKGGGCGKKDRRKRFTALSLPSLRVFVASLFITAQLHYNLEPGTGYVYTGRNLKQSHLRPEQQQTNLDMLTFMLNSEAWENQDKRNNLESQG